MNDQAAPEAEHPQDSGGGGEERPRPTLALCMIVRDVARYVGEGIASVIEHVDELSVVDTGSEDDTKFVIDDLAAMRASSPRPFRYVYSRYTKDEHPESFLVDAEETFAGLKWKPPADSHTGKLVLADYGAARRASFAQAESRYRMWIDSDDFVAGADNLTEIVNKMQADGTESMLFTYDYEEDKDGRVTNRLLRTRIIDSRGPSVWNWPIHETLGPLGKIDVFPQEFIKIVHRAHKLEGMQPHRVPLRNYKVIVWQLARMEAAGEKIHPRMWFFLGNESRAFDNAAAKLHFRRYVEEGDWDEERSLALVYLGQMAESEGQLDLAKAYYASASTVYAKPEALFGMARIAYYEKNMRECVRYHEQGRIALFTVNDVLHSNPLDRYYYPAIAASSAYIALGKWRRAVRVIEEGLASAPRDAHLLGAKKTVMKALSMRARRLEIIFHTSRSLEPWNAESPRTTGIGGSETAVVAMAKHLNARGHHVRVYCHCEGRSGIFDDGVEYVPYDQFDPKDDTEGCDVLVSSRRPSTLVEGTLGAKLKVLWMHDNHVGRPTMETSRALLAADLVIGVSNWHRNLLLQTYTFLDPERVIASRNAIDVDLYEPDVKNLPGKKQKLIYSSSPDRGLELAVELFKRVRAEVPDAELHVFYGTTTIDLMIEQFPESEFTQKLREDRDRINSLMSGVDGIHVRGRVSQAQLAKEFMEAKVLFYPTNFEESSCITAMEAQAAGCTPVTTRLAALEETVHHGFLLVPPAGSEKYNEAFVKRAVWCLKNEGGRAHVSTAGRVEALKIHRWEDVAREWEELLLDALAGEK
jgi:glycosyltransferase involved in cell wall biosynthesis